jgi:predicted Zn-ribbon and HTH transcriptional regulator
MRSFPPEILAALAARRLVARDFFSITVRTRDTGTPVSDHYWSDVWQITCDVMDPDAGSADERIFEGAGGLIEISDIPLVSNITVQTVTVKLSQVVDRVNTLVRTYDAKQAPVQVFRGLFDSVTRLMVAPAECRSAGFVDKIEITTPAENEEGGVVLTCVSHTQEMTRYNPDTRSDVSQRLRSATDNFYQDTASVGDWEFFWGKAGRGKIPANPLAGMTPAEMVRRARGG